MKKQKAFTLVELIVVIVIIGILASIGVVSYNGAQSNSRDNKRKIDLQAIASAYQIHYQDKKTWNFSKTELRSVNSSGATTEGDDGTGSGFINYESSANNYNVGMMNALVSLKYLSQSLRDPLISGDDKTTQTVGSFTASQYIKMPCFDRADKTKISGIFLLAKMESTSYKLVDDTNPDLAKCYTSDTATPQTIREYADANLMNYAVEMK